MSNRHSIELSNVSVLRDGRYILRDVTWSVPAGGCVAILGPNGSGKSTLARVLACHLWPTHGEVTILGGKFGETSLPELRHSVRLIQPAGPYDIDPTLTASEVVLTGYFGTLALYADPTAAQRAEAERLLGLVGLSAVASHRYETLSSGERVRSLIARSLVLKPKLLLLDEPTNGLDLLAREQILATVSGLLREPDPPTLVMITHHVEELPPATSDVLILQDGGVAARGKPADVLRPELLSSVYGVPVDVRRSGERFYVEVHPSAWNGLLARKA